MSFQIPNVHLPRSITFASYIAFSASKGYLTLTFILDRSYDLFANFMLATLVLLVASRLNGRMCVVLLLCGR